MFLATTAHTELWDKNQEILCLGNWCLRGSRRSEWAHLRVTVLPSPWDDRGRFYDAAGYMDRFYERTLCDLADYMNVVHGVSHSLRYWRILLGPWLLCFTHQVYDLYTHLFHAFRFAPDLQTIVVEPPPFLGIRDAATLANLFASDRVDSYCQQIVSQILAGMGKSFPKRCMPVDISRNSSVIMNNEEWYGLKDVSRVVLNCVYEKAGSIFLRLRAKKIILCSGAGCSPFPLSALPRMWARGLPIVPFKVRRLVPEELQPIWDGKRRGLSTFSAHDEHDEFERIFFQFLPNNFPTLYLEGFQKMKVRLLDWYREFPGVLLSSAGWYYDEDLKFLAAEAVERQRTRLIAVQHGGSYGQLRYFPCESHEVQLADCFIAWGWSGASNGTTQNLPSPMLSEISSRALEKASTRKAVLFVSDTNNRCNYRLQTAPLATQLDTYVEWQQRFLGAVSSQMRSRVIFRPHPVSLDHPFSIDERIAHRWPDVQSDAVQPFFQLLKQSRLAVIDYCGTALLQILAANIPMILYLDSRFWEMRDEAQPYFGELRRAGILWDSPEGAAEKLAEVYDVVDDWWSDGYVQQARQRFASRYALARYDWVDRWCHALKRELSIR